MSVTETSPQSRPDPAPRARRHRLRPLAVAAAASLAIVGLAACGGGTEDTAAASASDGSSSQASGGTADMEAYQECLAENGVELPDMGGGMPQGGAPGGAPGGDDEAFGAAQEACADLVPEGMGQGGPGMGQGGMGSEEMQAYTDCLTENGVELTQPEAPTAGAEGDTQPPAGGGAFADLDESDPAVAACADLRPEMPTPPDGAQGQQGTDGTDTTVASS